MNHLLSKKSLFRAGLLHFKLFCLLLSIRGSNASDSGKDEIHKVLQSQDVFIESLEFIPRGRDFYRKFLRQSKPVVFKGAVKNAMPDGELWNDIYNADTKLQKELFTFDDKTLSFASWFNVSKAEENDIELIADKSNILEKIHLPLMLQCKEFKLLYGQMKLSIISHKLRSQPKMIHNEMMLFSLGHGIKVELYENKHSSGVMEEFENMEDDQIHVNHINSVNVTLSQGDILYIPKHWWVALQAEGQPGLAFKLFFNLVLTEANKQNDHGISKKTTKGTDENGLDSLPDDISCTRLSLSMRQVLRINESDPKSLQLRIPKKVQRPQDAILQSGYKMPVLGLGTAFLNESTTEIVKYALNLGYRLIDTAQGYPGSEVAIAQAMLESSVPRSEIFLVTKLHPRYLGYDSTIKAIDMSLKLLNVDYIDLFLIHSKECDELLLKCNEGEPYGTWQDSWRAMEHAHRNGKIRSLGVSNFHVSDLKKLQQLATVPISVVQNWFDPIHQDVRTRKFCSDSKIRYMGYSTLGGMWTAIGLEQNPVLTSSLLTDLSTHYDYFVSSLVLGWAIHHNVTVIPRSTNQNHLAQNLRALDMKLSEIDISEIDSMASILDEVLQEMETEQPEPKDTVAGNSNSDGFKEGVGDHDNISSASIWTDGSKSEDDIGEKVIGENEEFTGRATKDEIESKDGQRLEKPKTELK